MAGNKEMTGKPTLIKEVNRGLLKDALDQMGQATRVELSKKTGISQPTVNVLMKEMTEKKEVLCLGSADSTGGRKAEVYTLNRKRYHIISVIVRKELFEYCIFDLQLKKEVLKQIPREKGVSYAQQLINLLKELGQKIPDVQAVCVGVPGAVSGSGKVFAIPQIPEWEQFELKSFLEGKCALPVKVINDINAVAMGYAASERMSAERPVQNLIYLHVENTGLGAGIIIDGKLYPGCSSFAGEVGYMQIGETSTESQLTGADEAKKAGLLSRVLINMICVLNPEKVVLGGSVTKDLVRETEKQCRIVLPIEAVPEFVMITDSREPYFMGLGQAGIGLLDHQIRLH